MHFLDIVHLKYNTHLAPIGECCIVNAYSRCNLCNIPAVLLGLAHWMQYETWSQMIIWNYENERKTGMIALFHNINIHEKNSNYWSKSTSLKAHLRIFKMVLDKIIQVLPRSVG